MTKRDYATEPYRRSAHGGSIHRPDLTHHSLEWRGFLVEVVLRPVGARKEVTELHLSPIPGQQPQPLTGPMLRELPLGQMARDALWIEAQGDLHALEGEVGEAITKGDAFYASVADHYVDLIHLRDQRPAETMAQALGVSRRTVHAWLGKARKRGLLTSAGPGQVGGELTDKARDLLSQDHHEGD
jgi:hypothetical protein